MRQTSQASWDSSNTGKTDLFVSNQLLTVSLSYSTEQIREAYYAYRDNVIFRLSRDLQRPKQVEAGATSGNAKAITGPLPSFEELQPFDGENKWTLTASVEISDGNQPLLMQRGLDQLAQVKHDFGGVFEFGMIPRRQLDTRVLSFNQSMRI